jgi:poly(3-hydroxyalkanoate) synthetase
MPCHAAAPVTAPLLRRGPRPLLLHLTLAMLKSATSLAAWQSSKAGWPMPRDLGAQARALLESLAANQADGFPQALLAEVLAQDAGLIAGIAAYRRHPYQRQMPEPRAMWNEGETRLLDYGGSGPAVLFVPSLVNRAYVLDLAEDRSMLRHLATAGLRPLLLDWGWPGPVERHFTMTDYVAGRLERALLALDGPVVLAGYCMGGLLATAAAQRRPDRVRALALLATPWDFHAGGAEPGAPAGDEPARKLAALAPLLEPMLALSGTLPIDALQVLFAMLDPWSIAEKYRGFATVDPTTPRAEMFVAIEDWLGDGVPLAAPVARECLTGWYGANSPAAGQWRIAGAAVDPARLAMPAFVAIPARDRIVPPDSATPLADLIPGAIRHSPAAGHIGMVCGATARRALWEPLTAWVHSL